MIIKKFVQRHGAYVKSLAVMNRNTILIYLSVDLEGGKAISRTFVFSKKLYAETEKGRKQGGSSKTFSKESLK